MRAGSMTEKINFIQVTYTKDEYGGTTTTENTVITTRASYSYGNGSRGVDNNEIFNAYQVSFQVRIYHAINEKMIILWDSKRYRILSIEKRKHAQLWNINCELINE